MKNRGPASITDSSGTPAKTPSHAAFRAVFYPEPLPSRPPDIEADDGSAFAMLPPPVDSWAHPDAPDGDTAALDIAEPADAEAAVSDDILAQLARESERVLRDPSYRGTSGVDASAPSHPARTFGDETPNDDSFVELLTAPTHLDRVLASMGSDDYSHFLRADDTPDVLSLFPSAARSSRARPPAELARRDHFGIGLDSPYPIADATVVRETTPARAQDR